MGFFLSVNENESTKLKPIECQCYRVSGETVSTLFFVDFTASWRYTVTNLDIFDMPHPCR